MLARFRFRGKWHSEMALSDRIFLTSVLDTCQNPNAAEYDRTHYDPAGRHVHKVRAINQTADQYREPNRVKPE